MKKISEIREKYLTEEAASIILGDKRDGFKLVYDKKEKTGIIEHRGKFDQLLNSINLDVNAIRDLKAALIRLG